jgi:hypothetical protein
MDLHLGTYSKNDHVAEAIISAIWYNNETQIAVEPILQNAKDELISAFANVNSNLLRIERKDNKNAIRLYLEFDIQELRNELGSRRKASEFLNNYLWKRISTATYTYKVAGE